MITTKKDMMFEILDNIFKSRSRMNMNEIAQKLGMSINEFMSYYTEWCNKRTVR